MAAVKIPVTTLRPGMYVVDPGISWLKAPLLYMQEGVLASEKEINEIIVQGYAEAYYDPDRSGADTSAEMAEERKRSFSAEFPQARAIYTTTYDHVKNFMETARSGAMDLAASKPYVEAIVKSLGRNADALMTLSMLKGTDEYTYSHSVNVTIFAVAFAHYLGLPNAKLHCVGLAGLLHDYGKALIPHEILTAPRRLTPDEFEIMRSHVLRGYESIKNLENVTPEILDGVAHHHEKHNGTGYPFRLAGKKISLFGRILSLCDVYDALSSKRVYKGPLPPNKALGMMYKMRGQSWAPGYVERFIKMIGIFPVGTGVELSNGHRGIVCRSNPTFPAQPQVVVAQDRDGFALPPHTLDLAKAFGISITRALSVQETESFDIPALLGGPA